MIGKEICQLPDQLYRAEISDEDSTKSEENAIILPNLNV